MRVDRFFLSSDSIDGQRAAVSIRNPAIVSQIRKVLRLKQGDPIIVLDGAGALYHCRLSEISAKSVEAQIVKRQDAENDPLVKVTIIMPMLRGGRFEWALQKLTELGIAKVVPAVFERSVVKKIDGAKLVHWYQIMKEAAEQCERSTIPQVMEPVSLKELMADGLATKSGGNALSLICAERSKARPLHQLLHDDNVSCLPPQNISVIVGPEGGITAEELEMVCRRGFEVVSLGPRILRSETAAICALAQIVSAFES